MGQVGTLLVSGLTHNAERISREMLYLSSFRLWRGKALSAFHNSSAYKGSSDRAAAEEKFADENMDKWVDAAVNDVHKALFDYSPSAKPRYLRNWAGRIGLQFFTYRLNAGIFMLRNFLGMVKPLPGDTRKECVRAFLAAQGTTFLTSGLTGLYGASVLFGLISAGLRTLKKEDLPYDLADIDSMEAFKLWLHDHLGDTTVGGASLDTILTKGTLAFTGLDFHSRTSLSDIIIPADIKEGLTTAGGVFEYLKAFTPAPIAAGKSVLDGVDSILHGNYERGLEKIVPWAVVRNKFIATREWLQGEVGEKKGDQILPPDSFHFGELLGRSVGLRPLIVSDVVEQNMKTMELHTEIKNKHDKLLSDYYRAKQDGDIDEIIKRSEAIDIFNTRYGGFGEKYEITPDDKVSYEQSKGKSLASTWGGLEYTNENRRLANMITGPSRDALLKREQEVAKRK
jgi:hypothetical protein